MDKKSIRKNLAGMTIFDSNEEIYDSLQKVQGLLGALSPPPPIIYLPKQRL